MGAKLLLIQLLLMGGKERHIDYDIDRAQEFSAQRRGTTFTASDRGTAFSACDRGTVFTATERQR